jgi:hypothetical protein
MKIIYELQNPGGSAPLYFGITHQSAGAALAKLISDAIQTKESERTPMQLWICELFNKGQRPLINAKHTYTDDVVADKVYDEMVEEFIKNAGLPVYNQVVTYFTEDISDAELIEETEESVIEQVQEEEVKPKTVSKKKKQPEE